MLLSVCSAYVGRTGPARSLLPISFPIPVPITQFTRRPSRSGHEVRHRVPAEERTTSDKSKGGSSASRLVVISVGVRKHAAQLVLPVAALFLCLVQHVEAKLMVLELV